MNRISLWLAVGVGALPLMAVAQEPSLLISSSVTPTTNEGNKPVDETLRSLRLAIGSGVKLGGDRQRDKQRQGGYYVTFEKADSGWKVSRIDTARASVADFSNGEVLFFSKDLSYLEPDFRDGRISPNTNKFVCWTGALRSRKDNGTTDYNPCESSLTSTIDSKVAAQALLTVVSLGTNLLTGTSVREVAVDNAKVLALLQQTQVLQQLRERKTADDLTAYRDAFRKASTVRELNAVIRRYTDNDPDNLIPHAIDRRDKLVAKEEGTREKRRYFEPEQPKPATVDELLGSIRPMAPYCLIWENTANPPKPLLTKTEQTADAALQQNPEDWGAWMCKLNFVMLRKEHSRVVEIGHRLESIAMSEGERATAWSMISAGYRGLGNAAEARKYGEMGSAFYRRVGKSTFRTLSP